MLEGLGFQMAASIVDIKSKQCSFGDKKAAFSEVDLEASLCLACYCANGVFPNLIYELTMRGDIIVVHFHPAWPFWLIKDLA